MECKNENCSNEVTGRSQTCADDNDDLICDSSYTPIGSMTDYHPLTTDRKSPQWSNNQTNNTNPNTDDVVQFNITWTDNLNLSHYIFSWNDTGSWVNITKESSMLIKFFINIVY